MTTAAIFVKVGDSWARQDEDSDGYPEDYGKHWMASVTSRQDVLNAMGICTDDPEPGCADYVYKYDEERDQMVFWAGKSKGWVSYREHLLRTWREYAVECAKRNPNDPKDEWEKQVEFIDKYGLFAWEVACDKKTRKFIVDGNGVPKLRDPKFMKFVKPGSALSRRQS